MKTNMKMKVIKIKIEFFNYSIHAVINNKQDKTKTNIK